MNTKDQQAVNEIAGKIKTARLKKGFSQAEVAKKAGLNSNFYAKVERGEAKPSVVTLMKIIKALEIKSSEILSV